MFDPFLEQMKAGYTPEEWKALREAVANELSADERLAIQQELQRINRELGKPAG